MRKRMNYLSLLLLIILPGMVLSPLRITEEIGLKKTDGVHIGMAWAQSTEREAQDSHYIQLMKQLRAKVDGWLKDLNQRIESGDITRFEVRFLEILRSLLEWVREQINAQIESGEKTPQKKIKGEDV
jgi:hypothetical protein